MKKIVLFIFLSFSISLIAQNINIPDQHFKNYLLTRGVNTNLDFEISEAEAAAYTGGLRILRYCPIKCVYYLKK